MALAPLAAQLPWLRFVVVLDGLSQRVGDLTDAAANGLEGERSST